MVWVPITCSCTYSMQRNTAVPIADCKILCSNERDTLIRTRTHNAQLYYVNKNNNGVPWFFCIYTKWLQVFCWSYQPSQFFWETLANQVTKGVRFMKTPPKSGGFGGSFWGRSLGQGLNLSDWVLQSLASMVLHEEKQFFTVILQMPWCGWILIEWRTLIYCSFVLTFWLWGTVYVVGVFKGRARECWGFFGICRQLI